MSPLDAAAAIAVVVDLSGEAKTSLKMLGTEETESDFFVDVRLESFVDCWSTFDDFEADVCVSTAPPPTNI